MQKQANYYTCHWIGPVILKSRARLCRAGRAARKKGRKFSLTQGTRPHVPLGYPFHSLHLPQPRRPRRRGPPGASRTAAGLNLLLAQSRSFSPRHVLLCTCKMETQDWALTGSAVRLSARAFVTNTAVLVAAAREPTGAHMAAGGADWTGRWTRRDARAQAAVCLAAWRWHRRAVRNRAAGNISTVPPTGCEVRVR
jgi:hypothetical protein